MFHVNPLPRIITEMLTDIHIMEKCVVFFSPVISFSNYLTLKAPNKNCSRRHFNLLLLSFKENKA